MSVNLGTAHGTITVDSSGFTKGVKEAKNQLEEFSTRAGLVASGFKGAGETMTKVGGQLTKTVTAPIVGIGTAAVKTTATFDQSMSKVRALSGATGKDFDALRDKAIEMGAKTAFSASESADALSYMALAGWKTDQMLEGLPGILDLAAASQMDLATASDMVTDYLTAFGLEAKESTRMANEMAYAQANSNTTTIQLGDAFGNCAAQMHTAGQSMETTTAFLEAMANQGLKGSEAGTALSATMRDITQKMFTMQSVEELTAASTEGLTSVTGNMNDLLGIAAIQIGDVLVPVEDLNGNFRDLTDIMTDVEKATDGLGSAQKSSALLTTFTARSIKAVSMSLTEGSDNIKKYEDALNDVDGVAADMAETMLQNLNGQLTILKSTIETLLIQIGDILMPHISKIVAKIKELVVMFTQLSTEQKEQILKWAGIAAAIGPVLLIFGKLSSGIGGLIEKSIKLVGWLSKAATAFGWFSGSATSLSTILGGIATAAGPILAVVAAVAGLGIALKALYDQGGQFTEAVDRLKETLGSGLAEAFDKVKSTILQLKETLSGIFDKILGNFDFSAVDGAMGKLVDALGRLYEAAKPVIGFLMDIVGGAIGTAVVTAITTISGLLNGIISALEPLINTITSIIDVVTDLFDIVTGLIEGLITGDFSKLSSAVDSLWEDIKAVWSNSLETIKSFFTGFFDGVEIALNGFFDGIGTKIADFFINLWNSIVTFFTVTIPNAFDTFVNETLPTFVDNVQKWFEELPYRIGYAIGYALEKIHQWGIDMKNWVVENVPIIIDNIVNFFATLPDKIWNWIVTTYNRIKTWGADMKQKAKEIGKEFVENLINLIKTLPDKVMNWIRQIPEKIAQKKSDMKSAGEGLFNSLWEGMKAVWSSIVDWFNGVIDKVSSFVQGIKDGMASAKSESAAAGSHADGLSYVPYNGYRATLHEGERVLTKNEAQAYEKGYSTSVVNNFYSPKALDPYESNRLFKETMRRLEEGFA